MACARNTNIQNTDEFDNYIRNYINNKKYRSNCRKYKSEYPNFAPTIHSLSVTSSVSSVYSSVIINGSNFLPPCYGTTYVNFGPFKQFSGYLKHLPIVFYSTTTISFVVPLNISPGNYNVQVGNIYNGNFSPQVNQSYSGIPNVSNSVIYNIIP